MEYELELLLKGVQEFVDKSVQKTTQELNTMSISGYIIRRSPYDNKLFNVVAVDKNQDWLYTASSDVETEQAIEDREQLTKDLEYIQQNYLKGKE